MLQFEFGEAERCQRRDKRSDHDDAHLHQDGVEERIDNREVGAREQLGIVSSKEAQKLADERKLDLVKIAPNAKPPVCRIMDYGKYKFDQAKKEKEARKNAETSDADDCSDDETRDGKDGGEDK